MLILVPFLYVVLLLTGDLLCILGEEISKKTQKSNVLNTTTTVPPEINTSCGYESCPITLPDVLNVHIVPHTHNDVGWVKTSDQYYYENVQYILESVVKELWDHPHRKFIYAETYYFWKWWFRQTELVRAPVRRLVQGGRLAFVGGAWTMNDEAAAHYQAIIDQFTYGLSKLNKTFGHCGVPKAGWQVDPYGHSREFASLLAAMGYDGLFLGRVDYRDKVTRFREKTMQFLWRGDDDLGNSSDLYTEVLYNKYSPPPGFCFDLACRDSPITEDNVEDRMTSFMDFVQQQALGYGTQNVLVTMGADFAYQDASTWFNSLDKLIEYSNSRSSEEDFRIKLFYSTPECYLKAVHNADKKVSTKQDDFFPYATDSLSYWTGFYTSRPTLKYFERQGNAFLQMAKQLFVLGGLHMHYIHILNELKSAIGIMQHHDAISGTQQQHVAQDMEMILDEAVEDSLTIAREVFNKFMRGDPLKAPLTFRRCRLNESSCDVSENSERFIITVYNPLVWHVNESIRIPVLLADNEFLIYAPNGDEVFFQTVDIPTSVVDIPTRNSTATHEVVFIAHLQPLSYRNFFVQRLKKTKTKRLKRLTMTHRHEKSYVENQHYKIHINDSRGEITEVALADGTVVNFDLKICYYAAMDNHDTRKSGAYVFRTKDQNAVETALKFFRGPSGPVVKEIRSISLDNVASTIRLYDGLNYIENDWIVGPIDVVDKIGKEFVVKYTTNVDNAGEFFTDSNGRQVIKRKLFSRPQFNVTIEERISGNYYPVTNKIFIQDGRSRATVLTDRAEGGTSIENGEIELMLHRRLLLDDGFGLEEALNEMSKGKGLAVRGRHRIYLSHSNNKLDYIEEKRQTIGYHLQPLIFLSDAKFLTLDSWLALQNGYSWANALPRGLHLLTLEPWEHNSALLRLENYLELDDTLYSTIEIDLQSIFNDIKITSFKETTLSANQWIDQVSKWHWRTDSEFVKNFNQGYGGASSAAEDIGTQPDRGLNVLVKAKQIRTFIVDYALNYTETET